MDWYEIPDGVKIELHLYNGTFDLVAGESSQTFALEHLGVVIGDDVISSLRYYRHIDKVKPTFLRLSPTVYQTISLNKRYKVYPLTDYSYILVRDDKEQWSEGWWAALSVELQEQPIAAFDNEGEAIAFYRKMQVANFPRLTWHYWNSVFRGLYTLDGYSISKIMPRSDGQFDVYLSGGSHIILTEEDELAYEPKTAIEKGIWQYYVNR